MTNSTKTEQLPPVRMALEIEKILDRDGDSPISTDNFNAICDICEKWLSAPALAPFEKLVEGLQEDGAKKDKEAIRVSGVGFPSAAERLRGEAKSLYEIADRLSAVVEEVRGKK